MQKRKLTKAEKQAYSIVGRRMGQATFRKHGRAHMSKIGKKAAAVRWGKTIKNKK